MARRRPTVPQDDAGFTLVEVIVSLALLTITATAALYFFVGGTRAVSHQQQSQNAVVVANEAMEGAYSVAAKLNGATSGLVAGRTKSDVDAAWASVATAGLEGYSQTYPAWDPATTALAGTADDAVPLTRTSTLNNLEYSALTLVGPCYRSKADANAACGTVGATEPTSVPSGYTRLMRVIVQVTWDSQSCPPDGCSYQVASLIDPNSDLTWNNTTRPIAVDDDAVAYAGGTAVPVEVLRNDILGVVVSNPVRLVTAPTHGTATLQADGTVLYNPAQSPGSYWSGNKSFTYKLKDQAGRESNDATVRVKVTPVVKDDTATTSQGQTVTIPVTANDFASPASIQIITKPTKGTATVSGTSIVYTPGQIGADSLEYKVTDTSGLVSENQAKVSITVTAWAPPKSADLTVRVPATVNGSTLDLNMLGITGNPAGYLVEVMSVSANQGQVFVNGKAYNASNNRVGTQVSYAQQGNVLGRWTFQYRVMTPDSSIKSEVKTITLMIMPVAQPDTFTNQTRNSTVSLNIGQNDAPNNYGGTVQLSAVFSNPTCGTLATSHPDFQNGRINFKTPTVTKATTCTFTYTLQGTGQYTDLVSDPVTVTVTTK